MILRLEGLAEGIAEGMCRTRIPWPAGDVVEAKAASVKPEVQGTSWQPQCDGRRASALMTRFRDADRHWAEAEAAVAPRARRPARALRLVVRQRPRLQLSGAEPLRGHWHESDRGTLQAAAHQSVDDDTVNGATERRCSHLSIDDLAECG